MKSLSFGSVVLFVCSLVVALVLEVAPLPDAMQGWRPLWLALVLAYWALEAPYGFRLLLAWLAGLMQDILCGSLLGMHALFLVLVVFAIQRFQQRLRVFPVWQQALFLTLVFMTGQLVQFWLEAMAGTSRLLVQYMVSALLTGLLWPWFSLLMHALGRFLRRR